MHKQNKLTTRNLYKTKHRCWSSVPQSLPNGTNMLLSSTLWLATVAFVFTSKARADGKVDPNVILSVQLDLATYGLINVPDTAIECIDNHVGLLSYQLVELY